MHQNLWQFGSQWWVVNITISPFDHAGVFAETETTGIVNVWWTGIMLLTRARMIARLVIKMTRRCVGRR